MAQTGAMVDVVATKTGTHQLLKQVCFFIAALGRAKTSKRFFAICVTNRLQTSASTQECFLPSRLTEKFHDTIGLHDEITSFRCVISADKWLGEAVRVVRVIKTIPPFHAESSMVGWTITALNKKNLVVFDVVSELATYTTVGA